MFRLECSIYLDDDIHKPCSRLFIESEDLKSIYFDYNLINSENFNNTKFIKYN